MICKFKKF